MGRAESPPGESTDREGRSWTRETGALGSGGPAWRLPLWGTRTVREAKKGTSRLVTREVSRKHKCRRSSRGRGRCRPPRGPFSRPVRAMSPLKVPGGRGRRRDGEGERVTARFPVTSTNFRGGACLLARWALPGPTGPALMGGGGAAQVGDPVFFAAPPTPGRTPFLRLGRPS